MSGGDKMINLILALSISFSYAAPAKKTPSCGKKIQAFSEYEDIERGREVKKHSVFEVMEWSPDSSFNGFVVKKADAAGMTLRLSTEPEGKTKKPFVKEFPLEAWSLDPAYFVAKGLDAYELLDETSGSYRVGLVKASKLQCEDEYAFTAEGSEE